MCCRQNPESTPLLFPGASVCQYLAVDVSSIDMPDLTIGAYIQSLPTRLVQLPSEDTSRVAVLSWKWDFQHNASNDASLNVARAFQYAKSVGIQYLFIDIISIDQTLHPDILIGEVKRFQNLYKSVPVIAAYDSSSFDFDRILLRPWIFNEIQLMRHNRHRIVYVGHRHQGTSIDGSMLQGLLSIVPRSQTNSTAFIKQLQIIWTTDYVMPILGILNGDIDMTNVYDFKSIFPELEEVLLAAEKLDKNEYLLTVALLVRAMTFEKIEEYQMGRFFSAFTDKTFTIRRHVTMDEWEEMTDSPPGECTIQWTCRYEIRMIYWGTTLLASFVYYDRKWSAKNLPIYSLALAPGMERCIFEILGLDSEAFCRHRNRVRERRQKILGNKCFASISDIRVVEIRPKRRRQVHCSRDLP